MTRRWINIIFVLGILCVSLVSTVSTAGTNENSNAPYLILVITTSLSLILVFSGYKLSYKLKLNSRNSVQNSVEVILVQYLAIGWIFIILAWFFGVFNSTLNGTNPSYVFRNFFGMLLYGLIPVAFMQVLLTRYVYLAIIFAGVLQVIYLLYFTYHMSVFSVLGSLSGLRVVHNPATIMIYPLLSVSVAFLFFPKNYFSDHISIRMFNFLDSKIVLILILIAIIVPGASKGHFLASFFIIFCIWILATIAQLKRKRLNLLFGGMFFVCVVLYLLPNDLKVQFIHTFSSEELSNSIRSTQSSYLIAEFSFLGAGLGAPLQSGYVRDGTGYGFELSYLNIIHKLGIFSVSLFLYYTATGILIVYRILHNKFLLSSFVAMGLMSYLIVGAGNPILLSATGVVLHVMAIYLLLFPERQYR